MSRDGHLDDVHHLQAPVYSTSDGKTVVRYGFLGFQMAIIDHGCIHGRKHVLGDEHHSDYEESEWEEVLGLLVRWGRQMNTERGDGGGGGRNDGWDKRGECAWTGSYDGRCWWWGA